MSAQLRGERLLDLIAKCLNEGATIDIEGMGSFGLGEDGRVLFEPNDRIRVFLAYAEEDRQAVKALYCALRDAGFEPWMDQEKLLPGQNWPRAIERAIEVSDFFLGCFSRRSTSKRGHFQCELRYALDLAGRMPLEDVFLVPVRLDDCQVPRHIAGKTQYVDLFPGWDRGITTLAGMMRRQVARQKRRRELLERQD